MLPGKTQGAQRPTAMGSMLQAATYGQTIPNIYGMTQSALLPIWAANLRQGGSVKKFKQYKKGIVAYVENIDILLGHNPIRGVFRFWNNGGQIPLNFVNQTFTSTGGRQTFSVTDSNFYAVVAVAISASFDVTFDDYGGGGSNNQTGTYEIPLWNELETGPDPTDPMAYRCWPYCYRWLSTYGTDVYIDAENFPTGTVTVYYAQLNSGTSGHTPLAFERLAFEAELGSGSEYSDADLSAQQIIYPMFAGMGSSEIDLGSGGVIPSLTAEVAGKWGLYSAGDADFADMIEDVFKSGLAQAALAAETANTQVEHGLSSYDLPGTIQKKTDANTTTSMPPMSYDMTNVPGNVLVVTSASSGTLGISSSNGETWTPVLSSALGYQVWYAYAIGGASLNTVTISGSSTPWEMTIYEIGGVGTNGLDQVTAISGGTPTLPTAAISINVGVSPVQNGGATGIAQFGGWQLQAPLPTGAVINGLYPILGVTTSGGGDFLAGYGTYVDAGTLPGPGGFIYPSGFPASGEYYGDSVGSNLSDLYDVAIGVEVSSTVYLVPAGTLSAGAAFAILYTGSPQSSPPTPPFGEPFAPGAGQYWAWAIPTAATGYGPRLYYPYDSDGEVFYIPNGDVFISTGANSATLGPGTTGPPQTSIPATPGTAFISNSTTEAAVSTTQQGLPAFLLALPWYSAGAPANMQVPIWKLLTPPNLYGNTPPTTQAHGRIVYSPGSYPIAEPGTPSQLVLMTFKANDPVSYPIPLGDFIDIPSLDQVRLQCRANGLWGSLTMNQQQDASDWLKTLYDSADAAGVFLGFKLYSQPLSEVSQAGNGAIYIAPTAGGPVYNLSTENGDFVTQGSDPPIKVTTAMRIDQPNVLQMQCINRTSNYNQSVVSQPDAASISLFGIRKADPIINNAVQDVSVARLLLGIQVRKLQYGGDEYSFTLNAKWSLLAPYGAGGGGNNDAVITITDPLANINQIPVRITSIKEQTNGSLACTAEAFIYGMYDPSPLPADSPTPNSTGTNTGAGSINAPIFIETVPRLQGNQTQAQLWIVVSSPDANYGGAQTYISTDGGSSYNPIGDPIVGSATTGESTADWPAAADPDTTNNLPLDLSESLGELASYSTTARDNFQYPCYIEGGGSYGIPYELMTYNTATLTAEYMYTLEATGSGNELRRGVYAAPAAGIGVDHPSGSRWAFLNPSGIGILKLPLDAAWIGTTLYFKFVTFNNFGTATQTLADATAYPFTPTGIPGSSGPATGILVNGS